MSSPDSIPTIGGTLYGILTIEEERMKPVIHPLSPELTERFFDFFDHRAFVDNPDWAGCYCTLYHFPGSQEEWEKRPGEQNRLEAARLIERGSLTGYLAFDGEKPIGWCNVNLKSTFPFLKNYPRLETDDDDSTASVVCFTVDPDYRGRGIAASLLERAIRDYTAMPEFRFLEGYPRKSASTQADNYVGPSRLYEKLGFSVYREYDDIIIMRKDLGR